MLTPFFGVLILRYFTLMSHQRHTRGTDTAVTLTHALIEC